ncbi:hemolysin family protein [Sphingobacterium sp. SYP-B4668]|uniref:hemolysin family protein n=1 Tax=Sphingobacterium sp. SYP-B4668 TaxID=2996035 RepID=UPI0022DCE6CC|nr:hemolysin family protein [Sphingobacterium sp. SYP-B4668]
MLTEIIVILILIVLNGVLSASEIAIVSSRKARLQAESSKKNASAKIALSLKESPNQFLSTVQIGITLIGILTGFFSGGSISSFLQVQLQHIEWIAPYSQQLSVVLVVILITYLSLVIGELVPKRIGMAIPEKYAILVAVPMNFLSKIMRPFVWFLSSSTDFIVKLLNIKVSKNTVTEEEIKALVDEGVDSGIIDNFEHDIVDRLLGLGDKRAINLMVHRGKIAFLDLDDTFEENKEIIMKSKHTVYPICQGNFDQIRGVVHVKTLLMQYLTGQETDLEKLIQPIPYINENSPALTVLASFKNSKSAQAIVIDEYGIPQGIITLKDILTGLVGDFEEEVAEHDRHMLKREDGSFLVNGRYQLDDFLETFEIGLDEEEEEEINNVTTIAGLVFSILDRIPAEGDKVTFKSLSLEVIDMDGNRIDKLLVTKLPEPRIDNYED